MPFTPLHMGPGMLVKAAAPRHFSIIVFGMVQIVLDLEPLWYMSRRDWPLHRFCHTYLGATMVAVVCAVLGKPISQLVKYIWNYIVERRPGNEASVIVRTSWLASATASVVGAYSHVFLDSLFHHDIEPLQPWWASNPLSGIINPVMLQIGCVFLGVIGLVWFFGRETKRRKADQ